jgi:hypothetical protein
LIYLFWATTTTKKIKEIDLITAQNCISTVLTKLKIPEMKNLTIISWQKQKRIGKKWIWIMLTFQQ